MKHLGDITKIHGNEIDAVDCITGGSPCQDLSIAGKREGLAGNRSGLFTEMIRIIKEMRERDIKDGRTDYDIRPRFVIWENVPGAFSSNKGADFGCVLEEFARIKEPSVTIPRPTDRKGRIKWKPAGCIVGNSWSIAWRTLDAQFWGVPQRRKRIALVADFGGATAPEILFERKGLSRDTSESGKEGQGIAENSERSTNPTSYTLKIRGGREIDSLGHKAGKGALIQTELSATLGVTQDQTLICLNDQGGQLRAADGGDSTPKVCYRKTSHAKSKEDGQGWQETEVNDTLNIFDNGESRTPTVIVEVAQPLRAADGGDSTPKVVCIEGNGSRPSHRGDGYSESETMYTLNSTEHHAVAVENHPADSRVKVSDDGMVQTLSSRMGTGGGNVPMVLEELYTSSKASYHQRFTHDGKAESQCWREDDASNTLVNGTNPGYQNGICTFVVRRLTPMECERLQGFPDGWTDIGDWTDSKGKLHKPSDSARYKALGNSIALPQWQWIIDRMAYYLPQGATLGSLFDGIGGFPLCWQRTHGNGTAVWASEVEKFCIAVTNKRFNGK